MFGNPQHGMLINLKIVRAPALPIHPSPVTLQQEYFTVFRVLPFPGCSRVGTMYSIPKTGVLTCS